MLQRLSGPLTGLFARGAAERAEDGIINLYLTPREAREGGMISISMYVLVYCPACAADRAEPCARCRSQRSVDALYTAWLAVRPETADGTLLSPSASLDGMLRPVTFRTLVR